MIVASATGLILIGAARMTTRRSERYTTAGILLGILVGWYALAVFLGRTNVYWAVNNPVVPTILFGILIPIVVGFYGLTRNARFARLVEAVPLSALVGIQVLRVIGAIFLVLWADGQLPWQFALPAGIGDVATGVLAVVVAVNACNRRGRGKSSRIRLVHLWYSRLDRCCHNGSTYFARYYQSSFARCSEHARHGLSPGDDPDVCSSSVHHSARRVPMEVAACPERCLLG